MKIHTSLLAALTLSGCLFIPKSDLDARLAGDADGGVVVDIPDETDADGTDADADGTDADGTDADADGTDADADGTDADGTDADGSDNLPPQVTSIWTSADETGVLYTNDIFSVLPYTFDAEDDEVSNQYAWHVNGEIIVENSETTFSGVEYFNKDDVVFVAVTPSDSLNTGEPYISASFPVMNTVPTTPVAEFNQMPGWRLVSAGGEHSCAISFGDEVQCWGDDTHGQVSDTPSGPFRTLSTGENHTCAIAHDRTFQCWGQDAGEESTAHLTGDPFSDIVSGSGHSCALDIEGYVSCWGESGGDTMTDVPAGPFTTIAAGRDHYCALDSAGALNCWGDDTFTAAETDHPGAELSITSPPEGPFRALSAGRYHSCAIQMDHTIACWGSDWTDVVSDTPEEGTFTALSGGQWHNCALSTAGTITCWGGDEHGQVEDAPSADTLRYVSVGVGGGAAGDHSCAIRDGEFEIDCWGLDNAGQVSANPDIADLDDADFNGPLCNLDEASTDADGDPIAYSVTWMHAGEPYPDTLTTHYPGDTISAADAAAGGEWSCQFHASDGNDSVTSLSSGYWLGDVDVGDGEEARDYAGDYPTDRCSVTPTSTGTGVGDISPDWELTDQHGESVRLSDFCGSLVLLQAGAMWDPTTAWTTSDLEELYLAHKDSGFIVMSLMGEDISSETPSVADLSAWAEGRELTFPVLSDGGFELTTTYTSGGLGFLPTHTLIGPGMEVLAVNETWISEETIDACLYAPSDCLVGSSDPGDDDEPEDVTCSGDFAYEDAEGCSIITGTLSIIGTDAVDLDLLSALQEVGGDLLIQNNDSLTSFSLDNLTQVGGDLKVWDSGLLTDFSIDNLTSIDGGLYVERNDNLESFSFDSLMSIGGEVKVENNPDLTTFTLDSLTSAGDSIGFIHNASLCQSMVDAFFETMGELGWSDSIASTGNADC